MRKLTIGFLTLALATSGCGHKDSKPTELDRLPRLETAEPTRTLLPIRVELSATVEPFQKADLCARVPGVVLVLPDDIDIGRQVHKDEELLRLDVPDLKAQKKHKESLVEQARSQELLAQGAVKVAAAEVLEAERQEKRFAADYEFAKSQNLRIQELVRKGSVQPERAQETERQLEGADASWQTSKAQIETKKAKLESAKADVQVAHNRIDVARAEVDNLAEQIGLATIRAPFKGVITKRWVDQGATIKDAGTPLLTVMQTDVVRVLIDVPERHVPLVTARETDKKGDAVEVRIPTLANTATGGKFQGTVTRMAGAVDPNTRTMRIEVHLDNQQGQLRPGMFGTAKVLLEERPDALTIPSSALARRAEDVEVFCVVDVSGDPPRGKVRRKKVELGFDNGLRVEIRNGLTGKELIIVKGNGVVREGDTVVPIPIRERD